MATLERKPKPQADTSAAISAASASAPTGLVSSSPTLPVDVAGKVTDDVNANDGEKRLVEFLRRVESLETVKAVNPKIAQAALDAAVVYVTNRAEAASWVGVATAHPPSVLSAVTKLASSGLTVSHISGEAFLVPRFDKILKSNIVTP